ncbi:Phosphatidylinositide phosphatase SAC1 [Phytophthora boehmeriae]|uniref:Phosphatidylinositide phosphatase SAC1 n=1 Tax=Phytophthora boehmeriae TaxID=109152 RepID=A0A8T1WQP5_9STRA|nr:Phosphatidylinositide phosphatase SAC1 [Phytophthora boehmeriae]
MSFRPLALECASEFIGTFVLVFLGSASIATAACTTRDISDVASQQVALGWGFAAALATFIAAPASGAHLNPAVTLSLALSSQTRTGFPKRKIPAYMLFQLLGATLAGLAVLIMFGSAIERFENRLKLVRGHSSSALSAVAFGCSFPHPQLVYGPDEDPIPWGKHDVSVAGALLLEALGAMIFMLIQRVVRLPRQPSGADAFTNSTQSRSESVEDQSPRLLDNSSSASLYIGVAQAALTLVMTSFTQACLNPARDLGPRIIAAAAGWGSIAIPGVRVSYFWVYLVGPTIGALAGSLVFDLLIFPGLQTSDEAAAAWMRHQQLEGDAILEQLEKSQTLLSMTSGFEAMATAGRGLHHSDFRGSPTPPDYRLSSPGRLHTFAS